MPKRSPAEMEAVFLQAFVDPTVIQQDLEYQVACEEARILALIEACKASGTFSRRIEVAAFTAADPIALQFVGHAAILGVLRRIGYEDDYYAAEAEPIAGRDLPLHVLEGAWELLLPIREGVRPVIKYRPSDEGPGYKYSLTLNTQGTLESSTDGARGYRGSGEQRRRSRRRS